MATHDNHDDDDNNRRIIKVTSSFYIENNDDADSNHHPKKWRRHHDLVVIVNNAALCFTPKYRHTINWMWWATQCLIKHPFLFISSNNLVKKYIGESRITEALGLGSSGKNCADYYSRDVCPWDTSAMIKIASKILTSGDTIDN